MIARLTRWHLRWLASARDVLATVLLTGSAVALVGLLALHDATDQALAASTILWLVATVAGLLAGARLLAAEHGEGGLRGLMLSPVDRRDIYLSRAIAVAIVVLAMTLITWVLLIALFPTLSGLRRLGLAVPLAVGAIGLGAIGALAGWAALSTRPGELVGPVLAIPLAAPLVIGGLHATQSVLTGVDAWTPSLTFATGYAAAVAAISFAVSEHVTEVA